MSRLGDIYTLTPVERYKLSLSDRDNGQLANKNIFKTTVRLSQSNSNLSQRYTLSSSLCFAFFFSSLYSVDSSDSNPTYCNRDVHLLPLFSFLLSFRLLLYTVQLITEVYTLFSVFPFLSLHNSTCNRGILSSSLWISVFFSLHNSTWDYRTGILLVRSCLD
ncbi:unnamed protein product [Acanthosepion pharaonis]|uniref:Uncharacterized protein n=1 Tax=Acanthosepion pharaonis TaxID=158019 RepID=A0A812D6Z1_ACAPH|nr:unnamed protein product [Sepia pharaonis]